ncbi:hypothetical protein ACOMHN_014245 [Nucella lapillus]
MKLKRLKQKVLKERNRIKTEEEKVKESTHTLDRWRANQLETALFDHYLPFSLEDEDTLIMLRQVLNIRECSMILLMSKWVPESAIKDHILKARKANTVSRIAESRSHSSPVSPEVVSWQAGVSDEIDFLLSETFEKLGVSTEIVLDEQQNLLVYQLEFSVAFTVLQTGRTLHDYHDALECVASSYDCDLMNDILDLENFRIEYREEGRWEHSRTPAKKLEDYF